MSIWHLLHNVKVKISSIFVAFLENMNFNKNRENLQRVQLPKLLLHLSSPNMGHLDC